MSEIKTLYQNLIEFLGKRTIDNTELPHYIDANLNQSLPMRPYQKRVLQFLLSYFEESFDGWIDDDIAFIKHWGFDLAKINKPVHLWQGDDDFMVPYAHSKWLEKHIPNSQLRFIPGEGHISLGINYQKEIIKQAESLLDLPSA